MPREMTSDEVKGLRAGTHQLKELLAELMVENRLLKKACSGMGSPIHEVRGRREAGNHPASIFAFNIFSSIARGTRDEHWEKMWAVRLSVSPPTVNGNDNLVRRGRPQFTLFSDRSLPWHFRG
jgi:hypothetical protein